MERLCSQGVTSIFPRRFPLTLPLTARPLRSLPNIAEARMPVLNGYATRKREAEQSGVADVYVYDALPAFLRRQLALIFTSCFGPGLQNYGGNNESVWDFLANTMYREVESFEIKASRISNHDKCLSYLTNSTDVPGVLEFVELCCRLMEMRYAKMPEHQRALYGVTQDATDGLEEINVRFRQNLVGYQYISDEIVRVDSEFMHSEVVKTALSLLQGPIFEDANNEFRKAHSYYLAGDIRDCNTAALRSMESALKAICHARDWPFDAGASVERLIVTVRQHNLFPDYLSGSFDQLIGAMKGGLPKVRDKQGGHAGAPQDAPVPEYIGGYALHLAASNIVLLTKAYGTLPSK